MPRLFLFIIVIFFGCSSGNKENWTSLFNGRDLTGWDTWLAKPHPTVPVPGDYPRDSLGKMTVPFGLNDDPLDVFSAYDMGTFSVLHITGKVWGALTTRQEYENFHLSVEYMWGEQRWAPRDSAKRDSGILYFCVGEHGAGGGAWMQSQECQVQEGDTGDYWSVAGGIADVHAKKVPFEGEEVFMYDPEAPLQTIGREFDGSHWNQLRCLKRATHELPRGQWNKVDVYTYGGKAVHVVNGEVVMVIENSRHRVDSKEVPLTKGKIQLQSEGAEIFYRNIRIRNIEESVIEKVLRPLQQ